jgi:peptidyl-prolyl cis-trans isomerase A (cyclophilin A)
MMRIQFIKVTMALLAFVCSASVALAQAPKVQGKTAKGTPAKGAFNVPGKGSDLLLNFETNMGTIHCRLFHKRAPITVANFVGLATGTKQFRDPKTAMMGQRAFYDGLIFHRVIPRFMIQGGCPMKNGRGGPGYTIKDEFHPELRHDRPGILSMANRGPNTGGSQFFITEAPTPHLDNKHAVFGECRTMKLVNQIARVPAIRTRPRKEVVTKAVKIQWGAW